MASSEPLGGRPDLAPGRLEIPLAALAAAAAFSALFVLPLFGALGVPLAAIPLVRVAHRRGLVSALVGCGAAVGIVLGAGWAAAGAGNAIAMAFLAAGATFIPTASVGFLRAGADPSRCYLGACLAGCAFLAASFAASATGPGPSVASEVAAQFDRMIPGAIESYAKSGADAEMIARMRLTLE